MIPPDRVTLREAGRILGCCPGRVRRLVYEGRLPAPATGSGPTIDRAAVEALRAAYDRERGRRAR